MVLSNRVHWGAIFAGTFVGAASMVFFSLFALAVGIGGVNVLVPLEPSLSLGAAIYAILSATASFGFAGYCTARLAGLRDPAVAGLHALTAFGVTAAMVPFLFTRAVFVGPPGFAVAPPPGLFVPPGLAWTLFLSFALAGVAAMTGGVQACYRESLLVRGEEPRQEPRIAA